MKSVNIISQLVTFLCLVWMVSAEEQSADAVQGVSEETEPWLIYFLDDAQNSQFEAVVKHIGDLKRPITESHNDVIKLLAANMTKEEAKVLEDKKAEFGIDTIEIDDMSWDSMDKSEL